MTQLLVRQAVVAKLVRSFWGVMHKFLMNWRFVDLFVDGRLIDWLVNWSIKSTTLFMNFTRRFMEFFAMNGSSVDALTIAKFNNH